METDRNVMPFLFDGQQLLRGFALAGEPWFVGADACAILGHRNHRQALSRLEADEKGVHTLDTPGGPQEVTIISEPGLYRLTFTSRVDGADRFKRWLAHEVLPAIRRTGSYAAPSAARDGEVIPPGADGRPFPHWTAEDLRSRRGIVDMYRMTYGGAAAQWIMPQLGFPEPPPHLIDRRRQLTFPFPDAGSSG